MAGRSLLVALLVGTASRRPQRRCPCGDGRTFQDRCRRPGTSSCRLDSKNSCDLHGPENRPLRVASLVRRRQLCESRDPASRRRF